MTLTTPQSDQLVGYRLIRQLGSGSRADVYLGVPQDGGEGAALKVFRADVSADSIGNELEALQRITSAHATRLDDVATGPDDRPVAILRRLPRSSLATLVRERELIELGEAVTILAPIVGAVGELHRAGVVHSAISAGSVLFGARGEPVLSGFGRAELMSRGLSVAALDSEPGVVAERQRLVRFVVGGLQRARAGEANLAVDDLVRWVTEPRTPTRFEFLDELEQRLFDLAEPLPVVFGATPVGAHVPARLDRMHNGGSSSDVPAQVPLATRRERRVAETLQASVAQSPRRVLTAKLRELAGGVRRPVWIALATVLTLLVLALSHVPVADSARPATAPSGATVTGSVPGHASEPVVATGPAETITSGENAAPEVILRGLLSTRQTCLSDRSTGCLAAVDQPGSAAFVEDSAAIERVRKGGEAASPPDRFASVDPTSLRAQLSERIGDAAIVSVTLKTAGPAAPMIGKKPASDDKPALILMIRTKAGWRIRSYLDSPRINP